MDDRPPTISSERSGIGSIALRLSLFLVLGSGWIWLLDRWEFSTDYSSIRHFFLSVPLFFAALQVRVALSLRRLRFGPKDLLLARTGCNGAGSLVRLLSAAAADACFLLILYMAALHRQ